MTTMHDERTWAIARHRIAEDVVGSVVVWAIFTALVIAVGAAIAIFGTIGASVWEEASQFSRWYAGAVGVYLTTVYLPLYVAHGQTRREFARQTPPVVAMFAAVLAVLMTVGFVVEAGVYTAFDWPQELTREHLFDAPTDVGWVFVQFFLLLAVWTVAGTVVGAGFYRNPGLGIALLLGALPAVVLVEALIGPAWFGLEGLLYPTLPAGSVAWAVAVCLGVLGVGLAAMWLLVREMPLRNRDG